MLRLSGLCSRLLSRIALIRRAARVLRIWVLLHGRLIALRRKPACWILIALIRLILALPIIGRLGAVRSISHRPLLAIRHAVVPLSQAKDDKGDDDREEDGQNL